MPVTGLPGLQILDEKYGSLVATLFYALHHQSSTDATTTIIMGIKTFDATSYRIDYIPQRLVSLEAWIIACHAVLSNKMQTPLTLNLGSSTLRQPDLSLFVGLAIDAGLVANRTLLNFLGIKLANGALTNESYALTIEKFSLALVSIADACRVLEPDVTPLHMHQIWVEALNTASKSVAHLTEAGSTIRVARLGFACFATSRLLRDRFFSATSTLEPPTILPADVVPRLGGVWDAVDPALNVIL
jgi:hypothetical protein